MVPPTGCADRDVVVAGRDAVGAGRDGVGQPAAAGLGPPPNDQPRVPREAANTPEPTVAATTSATTTAAVLRRGSRSTAPRPGDARRCSRGTGGPEGADGGAGG